MKELKISKLFPNKVLTKEEAYWVRRYYQFFCFEPIGTEEVADEKSFYEMTQQNLNWLDDFISDGKSIVEQARRELPYFEKYAYGE